MIRARLLALLNPLNYSWRGIVVILLCGFVGANAGFFILSHYTTSARDFCMKCHAQQSHSEFSKVSLVHPEVGCPECHAQPGSIIPRGFTADPEPVSENCLRCHADMAGKDETKGFKHNLLNITITHRQHVREVKARCTDCHDNIAHDKESPATNRPRMERCFGCHVKEATDCQKCHRTEAPRLAGTYVSEADCTGCHEGFKGSSSKLLVVGLFHKKHLAHGIACQSCHGKGEKHGAPVLTRAACLSCHHADTAKRVACTTCHEVEAAFCSGTARGEKEPKPSVMQKEKVDCSDCHSSIAKGHARAAVKKACADCHESDPDLIKKMDEWQARGVARLAELNRRLAEAKEGQTGTTGEERKRRGELLARTEVLIGILANDKSRGVHNPGYVEALGKEAGGLMDEVTRPVPGDGGGMGK